MDQYQLDDVFIALAAPTRRAVLARLGRGAATVGELAAPFAMALPSFMKHIALLERSGLVTSEKRGRSRWCRLERARFDDAANWMEAERRRGAERLDRLEAYLDKTEGHNDG